MPIPDAIAGAMLGTFRAMAAEIDAKRLSGPAVDELRTSLGRMESLAQQHSDIAAFSGQLAQENLMGAFGDAYGRALSGAARAEAAQPGGDTKLLARALEAYEQALAVHRGKAASAPLVRVLEEILALGRSGVSYLGFCRELEERGLDRALDGTVPLTRAALVDELGLAQQAWDRWRIVGAERELAWLDAAVARSGGAPPDALAVTMASLEIRHALEPHARAWSLAVHRWERAIENLVDWLDAHASFAPTDARWAGDSRAATEHNLARTRAVNPGQLAIRIELLARSGIAWDHLVEHETFRWEYTARRIGLSDERLRLVFATRPHAVVGGSPPRELVARAEELHAAGRHVRTDAGRAPAPGTPLATLRWA
ncbi:MAG: hypothetical protein SFX73_27125 [Kofleriaceae bacterium]|nr:hypothetical protein [Kofleriaceae bacterium]